MAFKDYIPFLKKENPPKINYADLSKSDEKAYRFIERLTNFQLYELDDYQSYLEAATKKVWCSFKSIDVTANTVLQTQWDVVNKDGAAVKNKELWELLEEPNPYETFDELLYLTAFHIKTTGNAYWLKDQMDALGRPKNLFPLLPQYIRITASESKKIKEYEYNVNGKKITLKPSEVIHFKRPHPNESIFGLGDIEASEPLFNTFINEDDYSQSFFKNGAVPSGILVREEYDGDEVDWERMKNKWAHQYTGPGSQGKTAWLNGKWNYIQLGVSNKDLQTIEKKELTVEQVALVHGVPLSVLGVKEASNYATARQEYINFRRHTVLPLVQMIFSRLNHTSGLIKSYNKDWKFSYSLSGLIDVEQTAKDYELLFKYGAITPNEYRKFCGLEPINDEHLDKFYIYKQQEPIEFSGAESILLSERYRKPSDDELNSELEENEQQLPDDPEKNPEKGFHPDSAIFQDTKLVVIDSSLGVYDDYPRSAYENAKKAYSYKQNNPVDGTKKMWLINEKLFNKQKLNFNDINYISNKSNLKYAKDIEYSEQKHSYFLDSIGGISMITWAQEKINALNNSCKIDWNEKAKENAPNYTNSSENNKTCKSCYYSEKGYCKIYSFKYDQNGHCSDYK